MGPEEAAAAEQTMPVQAMHAEEQKEEEDGDRILADIENELIIDREIESEEEEP